MALEIAERWHSPLSEPDRQSSTVICRIIWCRFESCPGRLGKTKGRGYMITREFYLAKCDQEMSMLRDTVNRMVTTYASNMEHVETCDTCDEVDNVARLIENLRHGPNKPSPEHQAAYLAMCVKMLHDEREKRNGDAT